MKYDIQIKQDMSGALFSVRFPAEQLDRKALYTIQNDMPPFMLPFTYVNVDDQIECVYRVGNRSKLKYRFGDRKTEAYIKFWEGILQPLIDCEDWFAKPFSFVMDTDLLFIDQNDQISYLYVPSLEDGYRYEDLVAMVTELSKANHVTDAHLEVQALQLIMQGFHPNAFLSMLRKYAQAHKGPKPAEKRPPAPPVKKEMPPKRVESSPKAAAAPPAFQPKAPAFVPQPQKPLSGVGHHGLDEIFIDESNVGQDHDSKKKKGKEKSKGLFGGFKKKPRQETSEVILGAAEPPSPHTPSPVPQLWDGPSQAPIEPPKPPVPKPAPVKAAVSIPNLDGEVTMLDEEPGQTCLRLVGKQGLPTVIPVDIQIGQCYTIGRFDVSIGQKQCDFEFDKATHAVSRHHAAIERDETGSYQILDTGSRAGTFVNGERLLPNVPKRLERGCRVAFGTSGADYVWEE